MPLNYTKKYCTSVSFYRNTNHATSEIGSLGKGGSLETVVSIPADAAALGALYCIHITRMCNYCTGTHSTLCLDWAATVQFYDRLTCRRISLSKL
jgi:hypothetical protein